MRPLPAPADAAGRAAAQRDGTAQALVVELPEELACHRWGTPYRPQPSLCLAVEEPGRRPARLPEPDPSAGLQGPAVPTAPPTELAEAMAPGLPAVLRPEPLTPGSRRVLDIVDLALEDGWLAVLHEPGGSDPALWLLLEAVADAPCAGGGLAEGGWVATWVDLTSRQPPRGALLRMAEPSTPPALALLPGPPPAPTGRRRVKLRAALEAACRAAGGLLRHPPGADGWLRRHRARVRLYLTMAALVYLRPGRAWPPPARLVVEAAPSAGAAGAGTAPDPPAAAEPGGAAVRKEGPPSKAARPR